MRKYEVRSMKSEVKSPQSHRVAATWSTGAGRAALLTSYF